MEPRKISRVEFNRITHGGKQYAKGEPMTVNDILFTTEPKMVWYHDRPYFLPPTKYRPEGLLVTSVQVKKGIDGKNLYGCDTKTEKVFVKPEPQFMFHAVNITGTVEVIGDVEALMQLIDEEPENMTVRGKFVPHVQVTEKLHFRPYVVYSNDNINFAITYKDGIYRINRKLDNSGDPNQNPYDGGFFWTPSIQGIHSFIQRSCMIPMEQLISALPERVNDTWKFSKSSPWKPFPLKWETARGYVIPFTCLSRNHLSNISKWMCDRIFAKLPIEITNPHYRPEYTFDQDNSPYWDMYTPDVIFALNFELHLRSNFTIPVRKKFDSDERFEPGRETLRKGGDHLYMMWEDSDRKGG